MANAQIQDALQNQLAQAANIMEQQVDAELHRLDNMDEDDFEQLRRKRMEAMKKAQKQKQDWMTQGHGKYTEIVDEKEFFEICKKSKRVVCHFYRDSTFRCKIVDKHLEILAPKHMETKFIRSEERRYSFICCFVFIRNLVPLLLYIWIVYS